MLIDFSFCSGLMMRLLAVSPGLNFIHFRLLEQYQSHAIFGSYGTFYDPGEWASCSEEQAFGLSICS
jgi:hypothetical protein